MRGLAPLAFKVLSNLKKHSKEVPLAKMNKQKRYIIGRVATGVDFILLLESAG